MDVSRMDLNLLRVFREILETGSVAEAAACLHVTPSAISHALRRLRTLTEDSLFIRSGNSLVPTAKALALGRVVSASLDRLNDGLQALSESSEGAPPQHRPRVLRIAAPGALDLTLISEMVKRLREKAPSWRLHVCPFERRNYEPDLLSGTTDLVLSVGGQTPSGPSIAFEEVWEDEVVCLVGPRHPLSGRDVIGMETYLDCDFIYPVPWPVRDNYLDVWLARRAQHRRAVITVPGYAGVGSMLTSTDLAASMPDRTAIALRAIYRDLWICCIEPPLTSMLRLEALAAGMRDDQVDWAIAQLREAASAVGRLRDTIR